MDTDQALRRPIGWWLKEADDRLEAAFDARLRGRGINRRGWQVLASVARAPVRRTDLVADLATFDPAPAVERVVADLHARGWLEDDDGLLRLTAAGEQEQRELAAEVDAVRAQVAAALPAEDYVTLVRLLARLVDAFPHP